MENITIQKPAIKRQGLKGIIFAILHFLHPSNTIQLTDKEEAKKDDTQATTELFQSYLKYYLSHPESTIRQRASIFQVTNYRSDILTKEVKQYISKNKVIL